MKEKSKLNGFLLGLLTIAATTSSSAAHAGTFPDRPITLVVPFSAGGPTDGLARIIGDDMARTLGQPIVIENKAGGSAIIGTQHVARARADGYTLLIATPATMVMNPLLRKDLPYDPDRDLDVLELINVNPLIVVTSASSGIASFDDLIKAAKDQPGKISYASVGIGSAYQLAFEYLQDSAGIKLNHIPYKGSAAAIPDVIGERVTVMPETPSGALPNIANGKLRPLAVTGSKRSTVLPNVPTVSERYPGYEATVWSAIVAPKGIPADVRKKLKDAIEKAIESPKYLQQMKDSGSEPAKAKSADEIEKFVRNEKTKWKAVIQRANLAAQ